MQVLKQGPIVHLDPSSISDHMLSASLIKDVARLGRLELPTYRFEVCRAIHLSYRRTFRIYQLT